MKLKGMIIGGTALVLLILTGGFIFYEINKTDEGASIARTKQPESEKELVEKGDNGSAGAENSTGKNTSETEVGINTVGAQNRENPVDSINEETGVAGEVNTRPAPTAPATPTIPASNGDASTTPETPASIEDTTAAPSDNKQSGGLYFATREDAIAFGFSRFTQEEIEIYNRAAANGLTPEQQEIAIQMAYSRFTAEEIAAIEEALIR